MKPVMTIKQVNTAINNVKINGKALDASIQEVGLSVLHHIEGNREVSLANKLFNALPAGARRNALAAWFIKFGKVGPNMDKKTSKERPFIFNDANTTNIPEAEQSPWFKQAKEKDVSDAFDPNKFISMMQAKLKKLAKEGKLPEDPRLAAILSLHVDAA